MIRYKLIRSILAVGTALILLATLISSVYIDLAEADSLLPHRTFENVDEECPVVHDADSGEGLGQVFFSILPEPNRRLLKEDLCPLSEMPSLWQKSLVLRC
jgi:hypothetical protein